MRVLKQEVILGVRNFLPPAILQAIPYSQPRRKPQKWAARLLLPLIKLGVTTLVLSALPGTEKKKKPWQPETWPIFSARDIGQFSPHFGAISLPNYTENPDPMETLPQIADFRPLSWSNAAWTFSRKILRIYRECEGQGSHLVVFLLLFQRQPHGLGTTPTFTFENASICHLNAFWAFSLIFPCSSLSKQSSKCAENYLKLPDFAILSIYPQFPLHFWRLSELSSPPKQKQWAFSVSKAALVRPIRG